MATTPELHEPQIAAARARAWHQASPQASDQGDIQSEAQGEMQGEAPAEISTAAESEVKAGDEAGDKAGDKVISTAPAGSRLLTLEAAREFVNGYGLVLFGPRSLGAPAPSLVEATLGAAKSSVTPAEADLARSLLARLVAEGSALPLNLLGGPGDVPDFVVSTAAFPFVFTLRGDKGWKRAPEVTGAVRVTTLALHVFEVLTQKGALTAAEIVDEVGREITESAVTRALSELWALLRVIPSAPGGGGTTVWELTTNRFLKAVKAGANAGQPTALSALIGLYLGQVYLATEDEICAFLSPLTARSRVRDALHGLRAGQQLSEAVLEGKTVLFLPESLPEFASGGDADGSPEPYAQPGEGTEWASRGNDASSSEASGEGTGERIRRFDGGGAAEAGRDRTLRGKPSPRPGGLRSGPPRANPPTGGDDRSDRGPRPASRGPRGEGGPQRSFGERPERNAEQRPGRSFEERRARPAAGAPMREGGSDRPSFSRPWDEEKRDRPARPEGDRPFRPARPAFGARDSRSPRREGESDRPPFGNRDRGDRPSFRREGPGGAPPFRPREEGGGGGRPFRSSFSPEGGAGSRGGREGGGEARPPRREGGSGSFFPRRESREGGSERPRPFRAAGDRPAGSFGPRKSFDRPPREGGPGAGRPMGGGFRPREDGGGGPPRTGDRGYGTGDRGSGGRPPFRAKEGGGGGRSFGDRPARPFGDRPARPFADRPARPFGDRPARDGEAPRSRPSGSFGDRGGSRAGGFGDRPARGPGGGAGGGSDGFKRGPGGFGRGSGGTSRGFGGPSRGPGGPSRGPGGFSRGPGGSDGPGRGPGSFNRGPRRGAEGDRSTARPRPEDEA